MAVQPGLCRTWLETLETGFLKTLLISCHTFHCFFIIHVGKILKYVPSFRHRPVDKNMAVVRVVSVQDCDLDRHAVEVNHAPYRGRAGGGCHALVDTIDVVVHGTVGFSDQ